MVIQRTPGSVGEFASALYGVASALQEWKPAERFVEAGSPARSFSLSEAAVLSHLEEVLAARAAGIPAIRRLASRSSKLQLFADLEPGVHPIEFAWFSLDDEDTAPDRLDSLLAMLRTIVERSNAFRAFVEGEALLDLYRGAPAFERARASLPEHLRQYLPYEPVGPRTGITLPTLLLPHQFDCRRVPEAIWWINFWDDVQLETLGVEAVRRAPWARQAEVSEAGLILVATEHPTSPDDPSDVQRLRELIEHTGLAEAQRRYS